MKHVVISLNTSKCFTTGNESILRLVTLVQCNTNNTINLLNSFSAISRIDQKQPHEKLFGLKSSNVSSQWVKMRKRYEPPHFRFKDLRHAFAKHAVLSGMDQSESQSAMGHSDEQMTKHYQSLEARMSPQDAAKLSETIGLARNHKPLTKVKNNG